MHYAISSGVQYLDPPPLPGMILSHRITPRVRCISTHARPTLPRLPVPPLRQTLDQYLKSIEPFLIEDEARGGPPFAKSYQRRVEWAKSFEMGVGKTCQERLLGWSPFAAAQTRIL